MRALRDALAAKAEAFGDIVKIGRTHLQDAVPDHARAGVRRLRRPARRRHRADRASAPRAVRAGDRRHRGRHGAERTPRIRRARARAKIAELTGLPFVAAPEQVRGAGGARRASCS